MNADKRKEGKYYTRLEAQAYINSFNQKHLDKAQLAIARRHLEQQARKYGMLKELRDEEIL